MKFCVGNVATSASQTRMRRVKTFTHLSRSNSGAGPASHKVRHMRCSQHRSNSERARHTHTCSNEMRSAATFAFPRCTTLTLSVVVVGMIFGRGTVGEHLHELSSSRVHQLQLLRHVLKGQRFVGQIIPDSVVCSQFR